MLAEKIKSIDSAHMIGKVIELKKQGKNYVGCCCFHDDHDPSFFVFQNGKWRCFGCGAHGDLVDFVQKYYKLNFNEALKFLGIENGRITPQVRQEIEDRKRKNDALRRFERWKSNYLAELGSLINRTEKLMLGITSEDLFWYSTLIDNLPVWEHHSDVLLNGDDWSKFQLFKEIMNHD